MNGRVGHANIHARLDRGFINDSWRLIFADALLTHLPACQSDHKPLLLRLHKLPDLYPRPFQFEGMWTLDISSFNVISEAWNNPISGSPFNKWFATLKYQNYSKEME